MMWNRISKAKHATTPKLVNDYLLFEISKSYNVIFDELITLFWKILTL